MSKEKLPINENLDTSQSELQADQEFAFLIGQCEILYVDEDELFASL